MCVEREVEEGQVQTRAWEVPGFQKIAMHIILRCTLQYIMYTVQYTLYTVQ